MNEITRYNLYPSAAIQGAPAPGYSSGQAIKAIQEVAAQTLPHGYGIGWEGLSYDESRKGNEAVYIFLIVVVFVYLVLVGQYESFILPLAVILSLPVGIFGSFLFLQVMGLANDVYAQIGLVMLVGLLGKNAILIVEFAVQRRREGLPLKEAAHRRRKIALPADSDDLLRLHRRSLPLVFATGAGAIGNRTIGTTGVGGMLVGTVIGVLVIPGLYYLFGRIADGTANSSRTRWMNLSVRFSNTGRCHRMTPWDTVMSKPQRPQPFRRVACPGVAASAPAVLTSPMRSSFPKRIRRRPTQTAPRPLTPDSRPSPPIFQLRVKHPALARRPNVSPTRQRGMRTLLCAPSRGILQLVGTIDKVRRSWRSMETAGAIACSMLLVLPVESPDSLMRSRDQTCRQASMERPARKTRLGSG